MTRLKTERLGRRRRGRRGRCVGTRPFMGNMGVSPYYDAFGLDYYFSSLEGELKNETVKIFS